MKAGNIWVFILQKDRAAVKKALKKLTVCMCMLYNSLPRQHVPHNTKGILHYGQNFSTKEKASLKGAWFSQKDVLKRRA